MTDWKLALLALLGLAAGSVLVAAWVALGIFVSAVSVLTELGSHATP